MNLQVEAVTNAPHEFQCKPFWLDLAEVIDSLRVFPRLFALAYLCLLIWLTVYLPERYFALPPQDRTASVTAFATAVLTAAYGAFPFVLKIYTAGGRNWGPPDDAGEEDGKTK